LSIIEVVIRLAQFFDASAQLVIVVK
jgi:hypothetical protein